MGEPDKNNLEAWKHIVHIGLNFDDESLRQRSETLTLQRKAMTQAEDIIQPTKYVRHTCSKDSTRV